MKKTTLKIFVAVALAVFLLSCSQALAGRIMVAVSPSGKCFHKPRCRTLKGNWNLITKEDALKQGYRACKICKPD
ncbi:MAG: hypothetical protein IJU31_05655 [Synergistaceae bacterium]|nr:hypothetical protein [Synergistaceae bacterium]